MVASLAARLGDPVGGHAGAFASILIAAPQAVVLGVSFLGDAAQAALCMGASDAASAIAVALGESIAVIEGIVAGPPCGVIALGCMTVWVEGKPAARMMDLVGHQVALMKEGSATVFIGGQPAARKGDASSCGGKVMGSALHTYFGNEGRMSAPNVPPPVVDPKEDELKVPILHWVDFSPHPIRVTSFSGLIFIGARTKDLVSGHRYATVGLCTPSLEGTWQDGMVVPFAGHTADDVLEGWGVGPGPSMPIVGPTGSVSFNAAGMIVTRGVSVGTGGFGGSATWTWRDDPDPEFCEQLLQNTRWPPRVPWMPGCQDDDDD